jgi:DNA-binding GntR family transcriptional regulator
MSSLNCAQFRYHRNLSRHFPTGATVTSDDSRTPSLADEAYEALRDRIVDCRLAPGARVTERQLAADLGFGLTPVRQALARLDTEDLVRTLPRRGYQITPLTIESVNDLFQVWRILGPAIAELAGQNMPADHRAAAVAAYQSRLDSAGQREDVSAIIQGSSELWMRLAEATGNRRLVSMYVRLLDELRRVFTLIYHDPAAAGALAALSSGDDWLVADDPAKARAHTEHFIDTAHRSVLAILTSWPSVVQAEVVPPVAWFLH